jgi:2-keto-4-pentenoate hydratase/2-oxohepta-3-ene-1,7-dioic acid hydratase in catechol pathway
MRLVTFTHQDSTRAGAVDGDAVVDLSAAAPALPRDMIGLLTAGPRALDAVRGAIASNAGRIPLAEVRLDAPVPRPGKFLAIGLNYADHVEESGMERPWVPVFFNKQATCVVGPSADVHLPRASALLDYEGELAFVIGRRCRHVPRDRAAEVIAGYTAVNDVSVRDWQLRTPTMTMGKSFDTHGPMGPWLVTPDEIGDPHALELRTWVNGELRQHSNTKQLIFDCFAQVEHLSTAFTLEPGDVITTGTPAGVGGAMKPPRFLVAGDVVRIEIERIGTIENRVVPEPEDSALI